MTYAPFPTILQFTFNGQYMVDPYCTYSWVLYTATLRVPPSILDASMIGNHRIQYYIHEYSYDTNITNYSVTTVATTSWIRSGIMIGITYNGTVEWARWTKYCCAKTWLIPCTINVTVHSFWTIDPSLIARWVICIPSPGTIYSMITFNDCNNVNNIV